jgi:hypothetical protein
MVYKIGESRPILTSFDGIISRFLLNSTNLAEKSAKIDYRKRNQWLVIFLLPAEFFNPAYSTDEALLAKLAPTVHSSTCFFI